MNLRWLLSSTGHEHGFRELYNQKNTSFDALWQELGKSDQLDIHTARRLILDHIPFYLRQMRLEGDEFRQLRKALDDYDHAHRRLCEAEESAQNNIPHLHQEVRQRLDNLAKLIERNQGVRQTILLGVQGKLKQLEYRPSSIPFELFQNADDAAVELGWIKAHPDTESCEIPETARRWVVVSTNDRLCFLHWGRCINARGTAGFEGKNRGFHRDLEKMLILSASDKQEGVTGKFGLGFKSVLLACQQPRIISGRLALEVVAGILPKLWQGNPFNLRKIGTLGLAGVPGFGNICSVDS